MAPAIWIVNQYARPDDVGSSRHREIARALLAEGASPRLLFGTTGREVLGSTMRGLAYDRIRILPFTGNGVGRVASMCCFALGVITAGLRIKERPSLVVGSSPHLFGAFAAYLVARRYRVPFVLEVRDLWPRSVQVFMGVPERHPLIKLLRILEEFLYRRSEFMVLLFEGAKEHIRDVTGPGHPIRAVTVPNGVDLEQFARVPKGSRASGGFKVVYTGAVGVPNSLETLIDAASILVERGRAETLKIDIFGNGVERRRLEEMVRSRGLGFVSFHDPVAKTEVPVLLAGADALVICQQRTDLYKYGLSPNKLAEYMASGRPIVNCLDSPWDPIRLSGGGLSVEPESPAQLADAIEKLMSAEESTVESMGNAARDYAERYLDWSVNGRALAKSLLELVQ